MKFVKQFMIILAISFVGEAAAPGSCQHLWSCPNADRITNRHTSAQCGE